MCAFICEGAITDVMAEELVHIAELQNPYLQIGMGPQGEKIIKNPG